MGDQPNDDVGDGLLSGHRENGELTRLLGAIKASFDAIEGPDPSPELLSFINSTSRLSESAEPVDELSIARKRKRSLIALVATGTTLGKLMIGMSAAAASVAGIYATGLVGVPALRDRGQPARIVATTSTNPVPSTVLPVTVSPETGVAAEDMYSFDAADVGSVDIGVTRGEVVSAIATAGLGWTSQVNMAATTVEIAFNSAADEVGVRAVLDGGVLHVVISDDRTGTIEEFWLDKNTNSTLPEQFPQPQRQPGTTLAPTRAGTNDKNSDDRKFDDGHDSDDESDDDDDDRDSDDKSGDDHDSNNRSGDARSDRYSSDDDESDEKESDNDKSEDDRSDRSGSDDDRSDDDRSDVDRSDDDRSDDDRSDDDRSDDD